jgi:hypothetical protein
MGYLLFILLLLAALVAARGDVYVMVRQVFISCTKAGPSRQASTSTHSTA